MLYISASVRHRNHLSPTFFFLLLFFLFFPPHIWILQGWAGIMSGETYCRENVYSSISSAERFSIEGCIFCLSACRGGALLPLMLGPQLFVFLIGFFCEEQKSGRTHPDVICNQSRKQASEFILGDAHGDSDSVRGTLEPLLYLTRASIDTRQEWRQNRIRHAILQLEFIWETCVQWWWR